MPRGGGSVQEMGAFRRWVLPYNGGLRHSVLRGVVLAGTAVAVGTELLGTAWLIRRGPVAVFWALLLVVAVWRRPRLRLPKLRAAEAAVGVAIAAIAAAVVTAAWASPPNSADAMAYHLPRVIYWAQSGSVAFFPTPYYNQVMLGPMAEYFMLHSYVLSGGDHFVNVLTAAAWMLAVVGVSALAGAMGAGSRGQAFAALFAATLPNGILQASGAKNDCLLALWLVAAAYFALRRDFLYTGLALGLALLTKGTAYLFAGPLLLATMLPLRWKAVAWLALGPVLINGPQWWRNVKLGGSPLGCDGAFCDGSFRWRNEQLGWKATVSNAVRHVSEQLGGRSEAGNRAVYDAALRVHAALGIDPQDPATTWRWTRYEPPRNTNHEASANNRWHLWVALAAAGWAAFRRRWKWFGWAAALAAGFALFCFYLKWQPHMARLLLPLFVLAAPLGGMLLEAIRPACLAIVPCVFLLSLARLPALENWTRPLTGPASLFRTSREDSYFRDMVQWNNKAEYLAAVERAAGCDVVTIDISRNQVEYPVMALLRERNPQVRFQHSGAACATVCISCDATGAGGR